jgi:hypothetical protein
MVFVEKLIVTQLVKKIVIYGTRMFITVFTRARLFPRPRVTPLNSSLVCHLE